MGAGPIDEVHTMKARTRHATRLTLPAALLLLCGCGTTTIKSDLVLEPSTRARIDLERTTQSIDLHNDSNSVVRVRVLDKKDKVLTNVVLNAHDQVKLDLEPARAVQFDNTSPEQAVVRWVLRNDDRIEYSLAMEPSN